MFKPRLLIISLIMICVVSIVFAQDEQCPAIVQKALKTVADACPNVGRNQLCYGNVSVSITPRGTVSWTFEKTGDTVSVDEVQSLSLATLNTEDNTWGISLMRVQANLPDTLPGQNVSFLLFGNVEMTNTAPDLVTIPVTAKRSINVRVRPATGSVIASLTTKQEVTAVARLEDSSWIRIKLDDDPHGYGWVSAQFVQTDGDLSTLAVIDPDTPIFGPMQAFTFKSGVSDSGCAEAPNSGILIQTPKGAGRVTIQANAIDISLGSTAYLQAGEGFATINLLEGSAVVTANGVTQGVPAGTFTRVPLGADGLANGSPELPQPYNLDDLRALPLNVGLPLLVAITPPLTAAEINAAAAQITSPGQSSSAPVAPSVPGG